MQLRLVVESPAGRSDVAVECEPGTPAREVLAELCRYLELPPPQGGAARCARTGRWVAGDEPLEAVGLRDGDRLELVDAAEQPGAQGADQPALVDLVVVGGPDAGGRFALPAGRHVVGRGPGADLVLQDRSLSRRHLTVDVAPGALRIADAGSSNGTYIEGAPVTAARALVGGELVEVGRSLISFEERRAPAESGAGAGSTAFNRPPRIARPAPPAPTTLPAPPGEEQEARLPMVAALVPLLFGAVMFAVLGNPLMLMFAALAPVMAVSTHLDAKRRGRTTRRRTVADFDAALAEAASALAGARRQETEQRRAAAPDAATVRRTAERLEPSLWERRPQDDDFLELRVGTADRPPRDAVLRVEPGGDRRRQDETLARLDADEPLVNVPVTLPLAEGAAGVAADPARGAALARWLLLQAAVLHSPAELRIGAVLPDDAGQAWSWLTWLPHVAEEDVAMGRAAGAPVLERAPGAARRLLLVDGRAGIGPSALDAALTAGTQVIWLAHAAREIPGACAWLAIADPEGPELTVTEVATGARTAAVSPDGVSEEWAADVARALAGVRDAGAGDARSAVPSRVSLLDLLHLPDPSRTAVADRWGVDHDGALQAPLGMGPDGPFVLDVGAPEGLRMLVAGMPGAGKSELLQTLIASLAVNHPPTRLTFLLVDYKGGTAFRACSELPHTVGLVTDLDARLADRARVSLLAELRRREALLRDAGAKSLRDLTRRDPAAAPPALLIVVDEFATLGRELPAFVDTLVDVAQRGRSLGLHLVLATQRPRGAVNDTLRANTNLRVAMRVSDGAESRDVIEVADAASLPAALPGRALALTGRRPDGSPQLTEFQAGYVGGRTSGLGAARRVVVRPLAGPRDSPVERVLSTVGGSLPTDLEAIVSAASDADDLLGLPAPREPWRPALPARLALRDLGEPVPGVLRVGLTDEPADQRQLPLALALAEEGHLLVYGASGAGKTNLLRAVACSLAEASAPEELHLYGLDFASRALGALEALPHCGSVIPADDEERVHRLLAWLQRVIAARKRRAADGAVSPGTPDMPRIVLLLDGYAGFAAAFERVTAGDPVRGLGRIAAEGRALGVHLVVTADRRADIPGALSGVVPARLVLRMAGEDEYAALGAPRGAAASFLPPGRGFTRDGIEFQAAWVPPEEVGELGERLAELHGSGRAPAIGHLPERLRRGALPHATSALQTVIAVDDEHLQPVALDLSETHALVAGPHRSGLTTALATIAHGLRRASPEVELHLLEPRRGELAALGIWTSAAQGLEACEAALERLAAEAGEPAVVVIDDAMELGEGAAAARVDALVRQARDRRVRLVAAVDVHAAQRAYGGWVRDLRTDRTGLLLQPNPDGDGELLGTRLSLRPGTSLPPGRGFLVVGGVARLVQVAGP